MRPKDTYRLKVKGWKNIFHANGKQKKAGIAIFISDKTDLKIKIIRDMEGHYIMVKGSIQEKDIKVVIIYAPNISQSVSQSVSSVAHSCLTPCDPMNPSTPGLPVHHQLPDIGTHKYIRKTLTDIKEVDSNTIMVGDFKTSLTPMDRSSKQKINKET